VVVAVIAVGMMQMPIDQVIDVIAMRHSFMAASWPMHVGRVVGAATVLGRAAFGIGRRHFDLVLVDVVAMHMVQMPVMQVVDVTLMADRRMTAVGTVDM
jgi:hypothetical protein